VSPDEQAIVTAVRRATRRARLLAIAEGIAAGTAAAATSRVAGLVAAIAYIAWRWQDSRLRSVVEAAEQSHPELRNHLITWNEIAAGTLDVTPAARERVMVKAASRAKSIDPARVFPATRLAQVMVVAAVAWTVVGVANWRRSSATRSGPAASSAQATSAPLRVTATIQPPAYTGLAATTSIDPAQIDAVQGSTLTMALESPAADVTVEQNGTAASLARDPDGRLAGRLTLTRTGYMVITAGGISRTIPIVVSPDTLPSVRITVPGRDLVYAGGNPRITFDARATDDYGLRSLALHYTKVSGSGEQFEFKEGEIPLIVTRSSRREWRGAAARSLDELELKDGDMLVYRAVAADERPGDASASSDAFFIEISKLGVAAGDAFTLPEEETRYALSQQMLIIKTERLHQRRASMPAEELADAALNLAVEQRMIRAEFVFMLGGEVQDEEVEAEQSTELQEGRLQNRGRRDLRAATIAMSQAEKLLTGTNTAEALVAERAAVTALQRAFARDRYILRALASRANLDPARRLTGDLKDASGWVRARSTAPEDRRAAQLQDVMAGLGAILRDESTLGPSGAAVLARQTLGIDPESAALRRAATELQRLASTWATTSADARRKTVDAAAADVAAEAARVLADSPIRATAPALAGPFADALRAALAPGASSSLRRPSTTSTPPRPQGAR
jgi:hypothetical protein